MSEYTTNNNITDECLRTNRERGVCPVKKEYLQYVQVRKNNNNINDNGNNNKNNNIKDNKCDHDNADSDSEDTITNNGSTADENSKHCENVIVVVGNDHRKRQRGMNKPNDRLQSDSVSGAERPTLEGEMNFFHSATLQRIKVAVKEARKVGSNALNTSKYMEMEKIGRMEEISDSQCHDINACIESDCTFTRNDIVSKLSDTSKDDKAMNATNSTTVKANNECNNLLTSSEITQKCGNSVIDDVDSNKITKICETDSESNKHVSEREVEMSRENQVKTREMLSGKLILAPLTTVGNLPFRRVCKTFGADVTMSEMAIAFNLNRMQKSEWALLRRHESEDIFGIQIAVGKVHEAYTFARAIEASEFKYDFLDINCGCPVDKVVSSGWMWPVREESTFA